LGNKCFQIYGIDKVKMGLVEKMEANLILAVNKAHKQNIDIINEKYTALDLQYKNLESSLFLD
jgi:hypothetical protein